jgi:hypothetical protein
MILLKRCKKPLGEGKLNPFYCSKLVNLPAQLKRSGRYHCKLTPDVYRSGVVSCAAPPHHQPSLLLRRYTGAVKSIAISFR